MKLKLRQDANIPTIPKGICKRKVEGNAIVLSFASGTKKERDGKGVTVRTNGGSQTFYFKKEDLYND